MQNAMSARVLVLLLVLVLLAVSAAAFPVGSTVCLNAGLNLRNSACGTLP